MRQIAARDRLIVALDLPTSAEAEAMIARLGDAVSFYKIGMELAYGGGLPLAEKLIAQGKQVFLDLKLHDIPNTVQRAAAQVARMGATFLTVHAYPQTMAAARAGVAGSGLKILAVTVMTSYDDADLATAGYGYGVADLVARRARQAQQAGVDGLILSAEEVAAQRAALGPDMLLVTPGIRPAGADVGDQKRVMTPARAISLGADHLVVGRPVTQAPDPRAAAEAIVADIQSAI
jgi:orotidine-5'-phosphate decarboxylase